MMSKTIPGKLLCSLGYHKMVTQWPKDNNRSLVGVGMRKCSRCGFGYLVKGSNAVG